MLSSLDRLKEVKEFVILYSDCAPNVRGVCGTPSLWVAPFGEVAPGAERVFYHLKPKLVPSLL